MAISKIIFIYNAKGGTVAGLLDSVKKAIRSASACSLCKITHGLLNKKESWQRNEDRECGGAVVEYFHLDDMPEKITAWVKERSVPLPVVLFEDEGGALREAVNADALDTCAGSPDCLGNALREALAAPN